MKRSGASGFWQKSRDAATPVSVVKSARSSNFPQPGLAQFDCAPNFELRANAVPTASVRAVRNIVDSTNSRLPVDV